MITIFAGRFGAFAVILVTVVAIFWNIDKLSWASAVDDAQIELVGVVKRVVFLGRVELYNSPRVEVELATGEKVVLVGSFEEIQMNPGDRIRLLLPSDTAFDEQRVPVVTEFEVERAGQIEFD